MNAGVLLAAGHGSRMGGTIPKILLPLAGHPALWWSVRAMEKSGAIDVLCAAVSEDTEDEVREILKTGLFTLPWVIVRGGESRGVSCTYALKALESYNPDFVAIHDGARPCVTAEDIAKCIHVAHDMNSGTVIGYPSVDTLQIVDASGQVIETPDRSRIWCVQTPQCFPWAALLSAYERAEAEGFFASDDAAVFRYAGGAVTPVRGRRDNLKLTYPEDIDFCQTILAERRENSVRVGTGFDVHRFAEGRRCVLGGVEVPHPLGLLGHSDADVLAHAVMDALLGAAHLGDIGRLFPDNDPEYEGVSSILLLEKVGKILRVQGWTVKNIDATVICQSPKIAPYRNAMENNIAKALVIDAGLVSVKGTTTEGLGFTGRQEGIAVQAAVSITCE